MKYNIIGTTNDPIKCTLLIPISGGMRPMQVLTPRITRPRTPENIVIITRRKQITPQTSFV
jgi:hypothetical protein